jgi:hydroxymethylglutaryl-CoA lyase
MKKVSIVEVGPRDGLQNEIKTLDLASRFRFVEALSQAGLSRIEVGAFVSDKWVPQMAGSAELCQKIKSAQAHGKLSKKLTWSCLVPNERGIQQAIAVGVKEIAIFASASESFSKKNINCTIAESLERYSNVIKLAKKNKIRVRAYLSMCFGCPFEGKLIVMGAYEVSIGDTIGIANPTQVRRLVGKLIKAVGAKRLALHFHDTRGTALANILASLDLGIRTFDSSLGGLGGCPYAPSATGNVATEDVTFMLHGMGFETGIDLEKLIKLNRIIGAKVGHELPSLVGKAGLPRLLPV